MKKACLVIASLLIGALGCDGNAKQRPLSARKSPIAIDGSSTVLPITEAVAREFQKQDGPRILVSGTGGGFKKLCSQEILLIAASRPINASEAKACADRGVEYIELPVAFDGIAVVVHPNNDWVDHLKVSELKAVWAPAAQDQLTRWSQVRSEWPDKELHLFAPDLDSGTYDYFTKAVVGKAQASRGDFRASEDDDVLARNIAADESALGFFGYSYYVARASNLKLVPVDNGEGPVAPTFDTIGSARYQPLTRPLFLYVSLAGTKRLAVVEFVTFYLEHAAALAPEVGYVPLTKKASERAAARFQARQTGSQFGGQGSTVGVTDQQLVEAR